MDIHIVEYADYDGAVDYGYFADIEDAEELLAYLKLETRGGDKYRTRTVTLGPTEFISGFSQRKTYWEVRLDEMISHGRQLTVRRDLLPDDQERELNVWWESDEYGMMIRVDSVNKNKAIDEFFKLVDEISFKLTDDQIAYLNSERE